MFALSNLTTLTGADKSHLLVLSQEAGRIVNVDRSGQVSSSLTIVADPGNPLSVPDQSHEGLAMDNDGRLYVVSEGGGGDVAHPAAVGLRAVHGANQAPTAVTLTNQVGLDRRDHEHRDPASRSPTSPSPTTASARTP